MLDVFRILCISLKIYLWSVNTFLDNFFKAVFPILYWC